MKIRFGIIAAAIACASLASCGVGVGAVASAGSKAPAAPAVVAVGDQVVVQGGRALILANLTYQTIGTAAAIGMEQGLITGETKVKVKAVSAEIASNLAKGERALLAGDKALSAAAALGAVDRLCKLHPIITRACEAAR